MFENAAYISRYPLTGLHRTPGGTGTSISELMV
jgi:hypothetical protein